jgi:hypothetical protein
MSRIRNIIISELLFSCVRYGYGGLRMCLRFAGLGGGSDPSSVGRYADKNRIVRGSRHVIPVCRKPTTISLYNTFRLYFNTRYENTIIIDMRSGV